MRKTGAAALVFLCILAVARPALTEEILAPSPPSPAYVSWLLEVAAGEIGYTEESNGYTKYGDWAGDPQAQWCAEFLCWCVARVDEIHGTSLLENTFPRYSGTNTGLKWFIREGRYIARNGSIDGWGTQWLIGDSEKMAANSYIPQPGDWVFYTYDASGDTAHVAMVEYCSAAEDGTVTVHVIEGNLPDRVQRGTHLLNDWRVLGYGTVSDLADVVQRGGCEGRKVLKLQENLVYLGLMDRQYATGVYGPSTTAAVSAFQTGSGLTVTGIANHDTQRMLSDAVWQKYRADENNWIVDSE